VTAPEEAARALAEAIGCGMVLLAAKPWHSTTFCGFRLLIEADTNLPPNVEQTDASVPGYVIVDLAQVTARRAEVLMVVW